MAGEPDVRVPELTVAGAPRELQVALEHLRDAVHPPVAERPAAGQRGQAAGGDADPAVADEAVGLSDRAEAERLEPEPHERRESVIDLRHVDVADRQSRVLPEARAGLGAYV